MDPKDLAARLFEIFFKYSPRSLAPVVIGISEPKFLSDVVVRPLRERRAKLPVIPRNAKGIAAANGKHCVLCARTLRK